MAVLQKILDVLPLNEEKRRFQRVRVNLLGLIPPNAIMGLLYIGRR